MNHNKALSFSEKCKYACRFLELYTKHDTNNVRFVRGRKSDLRCYVSDKEYVNFWFSEEHDGTYLSYGILGFGITSCVPLSILK
jgi:hypothetical protein